jgi:hypothetical protein
VPFDPPPAEKLVVRHGDAYGVTADTGRMAYYRRSWD